MTQPSNESYDRATRPYGANEDALRAAARKYREQADRLRGSARRNIAFIVFTVALMTVLVVVLPPIVNVAEDRILEEFGFQTSQLDLNEETALQAAEVRSLITTIIETF